MVSRQIVLESVKRMYASGVDEKTVATTLRDIGLSEEEIKTYMMEAKGRQEQKPVSKKPPAREELEKEFLDEEEPAKENETEDRQEVSEESDEQMGVFDEEEPQEDDLAQQTASKIKEHLDEHLFARDIGHSNALDALEEQGQKVRELHEKIDSLYQKISSTPGLSAETVAKINSVEKKLIVIEKGLAEVKASETALQALLQKVIETNRQVLNKMKK